MGKIDGLAMRLGRALLQTVEGAEEAADVDCAAPTDDQVCIWTCRHIPCRVVLA